MKEQIKLGFVFGAAVQLGALAVQTAANELARRRSRAN